MGARLAGRYTYHAVLGMLKAELRPCGALQPKQRLLRAARAGALLSSTLRHSLRGVGNAALRIIALPVKGERGTWPNDSYGSFRGKLLSRQS